MVLVYKIKDIQKNRNRNIGIFFLGNLDNKFYDWPLINDKFHLLSRKKIIDILFNYFSEDKLIILQSKEDLNLPNLRNKIVLNDRRKVIIEQENFLKVLSNCNFFLFTPGVSFPLCHNNFEAMASGCPPILQYPQYHFPRASRRH